MVNHLILSANYSLNTMNSTTTPPHFQIINLATPASPIIFELANDQTVFLRAKPRAADRSRTAGVDSFGV